MNVTVFRQTLRQNARMIVILSLAVAAFFYVVLLATSSFSADAQRAGSFFRNPPRAIGAFLGGSADFLHPAGWVAAGLMHPIILALEATAAFAVGVGAVATELERESIDLVLTRPLRRSSFLAAKAAAALIAVAIVQIAGVIAVLVARATVKDVDALRIADVLKAFLGAWLLFGAFAMIAVLISARSSLRGRALGAATGVIVGSFFVNFIALLFNGMSGMRYASAFHYFRPAEILTGKPYAGDLLVLVGLSLVALALAFRAFERRDLNR